MIVYLFSKAFVMLMTMSVNRSFWVVCRAVVAVVFFVVFLVVVCGSIIKIMFGGVNTLLVNLLVMVIVIDNKYDVKIYFVKVGDVSFVFYNKGNVIYIFVVKVSDGIWFGTWLFFVLGKLVGFLVNLFVGIYEVYCDVFGYKELGMDVMFVVS